MSDKWLWVLGGGLMQVPVVEEAHLMGYKVIVSDRDPNCACAIEAEVFLPIDIFNISGHLRALEDRGPLEIEGVVAIGIDCPETASAIQEFLGKPCAPREVARICHNKKEFRKAMRVLGYPVPPTHDVIVKPYENSGSRGIRMYCSRNGQLVEELWYGSEHTVETVFDCKGHFHPCFITDRHFDYSSGYALEVGLRHPSVLPEYIQRKAYQIAEALGRDLGVGRGPFKLDIIVTEDGVRVIEATTRWSGGWDCQYLVPAATGKNIIRAAILTAVGEPLQPLIDPFRGTNHPLKPKWNKVALSESLWPSLGKITAISGVEEAKALPGVQHIIFRKNVGDTVNEYVDCAERVCWVITSGDTEEEAREAMNQAKMKIHIDVMLGHGSARQV